VNLFRLVADASVLKDSLMPGTRLNCSRAVTPPIDGPIRIGTGHFMEVMKGYDPFY